MSDACIFPPLVEKMLERDLKESLLRLSPFDGPSPFLPLSPFPDTAAGFQSQKYFLEAKEEATVVMERLFNPTETDL